MINWKDKLLAYLHDPPHKPFRIAGHEDARGPLLRHLGLSEDDIKQWEQGRHKANPDWQAAAADRFPFPTAGTLFVDWKLHGEMEFRHPLTGDRFLPMTQPRQHSAVGESWVEQVLHGIPTDDAGWKQKFFRVWRLWPERCAREKHPILAYLVADTRIPDHTLWHHNGMVSALEAVGAKPAFLLFQIGPVQDFIAQARKTQDLWSGSYLLSFLISKALATVALTLGPDCVVYPNLRGIPLLDWWWSQEGDLFPQEFFKLGEGRLHSCELLIPSLPNRFLTLVPAGEDGRQVADKAQAAVRQLWQEIADSVHAHLCHRLQNHLTNDEFKGWDAHWQHQVKHFPVLDWTLHEWHPEQKAIQCVESRDGATPPMINGWKDHPLRHAMAWRNMIPVDHRESWHGNRNDAFAWSLHYATTDWKFAATKNARGFASWPVLRPDEKSPPKDHLNGRDEVLGGDIKGFWDALRVACGGADKGDFKGRQLYGAISVVKRLWPRAYLSEKLQWKQWKPDFESVQDIAVIERDLDALPGESLRSCGYYAVLCMDGDDMGQWVGGIKTPLLKKVLAGKAWDYFKNGKAGKGGWKPLGGEGEADLPPKAEAVRRPLSPSFHAALSEAISNFGLYCAGQIVEKFSGQMLFAGGDDVLAMLPAAKALECAFALQCAFQGYLPDDAPCSVRTALQWSPDNPSGLFEFPAYGFVTCKHGAGKSERLRPNWPLMVPGREATASAGIAIGHVRSPMQDTIQAAREAERLAKEVPNKGAFALQVLKRSGEAVGFAARWSSGVVSVWSELEAGIHDLSGRFAYRYASLVKALVVTGGGPEGAAYASEWTETLREAIEAELRHVLIQQGDFKAEKAREQAQRWCDILTAVLNPRDYLHFWMTWAFVNRLTKPSTDPQS
ncbi:MAG TPA: type III-B CRISPR-associated protein Cas10/Cmr2 [Verrucomicrobiota bacterium]|nr:type III-B CRISPR-associated protein Cas10/Cmr2 [Verrucomicrobiota bacterium]HQB17906.1 type III-B CRISPR-associated protein Cas10/Cmr2 [Verrucomicrobiota bacterium]